MSAMSHVVPSFGAAVGAAASPPLRGLLTHRCSCLDLGLWLMAGGILGYTI